MTLAENISNRAQLLSPQNQQRVLDLIQSIELELPPLEPATTSEMAATPLLFNADGIIATPEAGLPDAAIGAQLIALEELRGNGRHLWETFNPGA